MKRSLTEEELKQAAHPKEKLRLFIAIIASILAIYLVIVLPITLFDWAALLVQLILFLGYWIFFKIAKAHLTGNAIRVSRLNFPEIYAIYEEVKDSLLYHEDIPVFIIQGDSVNGFITKFFKTKYIMLNSALIEGMLNEEKDRNSDQLRWVIARFIGALKAKHFRFNYVNILLESAKGLPILNFFILPYERATQYAGDNIGLLVCRDLDESFIALNKLAAGNTLGPKVNFEGILEQGKQIHGNLFAFLGKLTSSHPHHVNRYINLLAFAKKAYPDQFNQFISRYDSQTTLNIGYLLPQYK